MSHESAKKLEEYIKNKLESQVSNVKMNPIMLFISNVKAEIRRKYDEIYTDVQIEKDKLNNNEGNK